MQTCDTNNIPLRIISELYTFKMTRIMPYSTEKNIQKTKYFRGETTKAGWINLHRFKNKWYKQSVAVRLVVSQLLI